MRKEVQVELLMKLFQSIPSVTAVCYFGYISIPHIILLSLIFRIILWDFGFVS